MKWPLILALLFFAYIFLIAGNVGGQDEVQKQFDHLKCQYPYRTTNPVDGCDNSDPCDTLDAVKGGSGECKSAELENPTSQNVETVEKAVESVGKL